MKPWPIGSRIGSTSRHAPGVQRLERRRQRVERPAQLGHGHDARAAPLQVAGDVRGWNR